MALRNSLALVTLKFDDVVSIILSKEVRRKSSKDSSKNGSALNVKRRERSSMKGSRSSKSKSRGKCGVQSLLQRVWPHKRELSGTC